MDILNIIFGTVGVVSLVFSVYTYYKTESKKTVEAAKNAMQKERYRNIRLSLLGIYHSVDSVVQIPKKGEISASHLQDLARSERTQIVVLSKQLELDQKKLDDWQYGKLFSSNMGEDNIPEVELEKPEEQKK